MAGASFKFNPAGLRELHQPGGPVDRAVMKAAGAVRDQARENLKSDGNIDTGKLRQSIRYVRLDLSGRTTYHVGSDLPHSIYIHEGTPARIYPRRAKVLRFKQKGGGQYVFARSVKGITGSKFLVRALRSAGSRDFTA